MKTTKFEGLFILFFIAILTLSYSYFFPTIPLQKDGDLAINFIPTNKLLDFSYASANQIADSLIDIMMSRDDSLLAIEFMQLDSIDSILDSLLASRDTNFVNPSDSLNIRVLDIFFESLQDTNALIHIAHYGASEAEGDRITSDLRKKFQAQFGGFGQGYIPMREAIWNVSMQHNASANWQKYTVFHNRHSNRFYGASGTVYRFGKYSMHIKDSTQMQQSDLTEQLDPDNQNHSTTASENQTNTVLSPSSTTPEDTVYYVYHDNAIIKLKLYSWYNNMYVMYGNAADTCNIAILNKQRDTVLKTLLLPAQGFNKYRLPLLVPITEMEMIFNADPSPDFYGLLAEGTKGVMVDNYAIRGHSGDGLLIIDEPFLAQQLKLLNTKLIILQFGANAVPYIKTEKERQYIEDIYYELLAKFKRVAPQASIIFLGVGDMATRIQGQYISYPSIPLMIDAQQKAAQKAGVAFWNWYNVMGGKNAIFAWSQKGLAAPDGHLAEKGQELFATQFFSMIMNEYNIYLLRKKLVQQQ